MNYEPFVIEWKMYFLYRARFLFILLNVTYLLHIFILIRLNMFLCFVPVIFTRLLRT